MNGSVDGKLFSYPNLAGGAPLSAAFAAGFEFRNESLKTAPDPLHQQGATFLGATPVVATHGSYGSKEVFGELRIPLLANAPFAKSVSLSAAGRYSDYTTTGGDFTYNLGGNWAASDQIAFHGEFAHAVRAPNIVELFSGSSTTFIQFLDPCDTTRLSQGPAPANRKANCAALGLSPTFSQDLNSRAVITSGNPNLSPESSRTTTGGVIFTPTVLPGLRVSVDYFSIIVNDVIESVAATNIIADCVDSPTINNTFCTAVTRGPDGNISTVRNQVLNAARLETQGWDYSVRYVRSLDSLGLKGWGDLEADFDLTDLIQLKNEPNPSNQLLTIQEAGALPNPRVKADLRLIWTKDRWQASYGAHFLSEVRVTNINTSSFNPSEVPNFLTHDVQVGYKITPQSQLYFGINNFTDTKPPYTPYTYAGTFDRTTGIDASAYSNLGRFYYAGVHLNY